MSYIDSIIEDLQVMLTTDVRFKSKKYTLRKELGDDKTDQGINMYEDDYKIIDGQYAEEISVVVEYYEQSSTLQNDYYNAWNIKERAKIFFNWLNRRYSKGFGQSAKTLTQLGGIRCNSEMIFFESENKKIYGIFVVEVLKRNTFEFDDPQQVCNP